MTDWNDERVLVPEERQWSDFHRVAHADTIYRGRGVKSLTETLRHLADWIDTSHEFRKLVTMTVETTTSYRWTVTIKRKDRRAEAVSNAISLQLQEEYRREREERVAFLAEIEPWGYWYGYCEECGRYQLLCEMKCQDCRKYGEDRAEARRRRDAYYATRPHRWRIA